MNQPRQNGQADRQEQPAEQADAALQEPAAQVEGDRPASRPSNTTGRIVSDARRQTATPAGKGRKQKKKSGKDSDSDANDKDFEPSALPRSSFRSGNRISVCAKCGCRFATKSGFNGLCATCLKQQSRDALASGSTSTRAPSTRNDESWREKCLRTRNRGAVAAEPVHQHHCIEYRFV